MILYRLFNPLRLYAYVPLRGAGTAMLQQPLHQGNIKTICIIDFCCIPLAKAVGADTIEAQVITDNMQASFAKALVRVIVFSLMTQPAIGLSSIFS